MALQVTNLERTFELKKDGKTIPLKDLNPELPAEEIMKLYAGTYPELTNAIIEGPKVEGDKAVYTATTKAGKLA